MSRYRNFIFTLNNYTEQHIIDLKLFAEEYSKYLLYGKEIGESGTPHLQGYCELKSQFTLKSLKKKLKVNKIHIEKRKATALQAATYCKKDGDLYEYGEISLQGKRKNIDKLKELVLEGKKLKDIILGDYINNYQDIRIVEKFKQYNSIPRDPSKPPKVVWIWGKTGTGKTRHVYEKYNDIYTTMETYQWWDGYEQQEVILIDDMRKDFCKFHTLLKLLDRYPHKVQIKGGTVDINSPYIYITSPFPPHVLWCGREDINQLLRRITKIIHKE